MKRMSLRRFGDIVAQVMETLPEPLKKYLDNIVVDVEHEADLQTLRRMDFTEEEIAAGETLYGLFDPLPLPDTSGMDFDDPPHRIIIYKRPLEEDFPDPHALMMEIRKTVIHELAHHFGYTDRDLEQWTDVY
jgi:predicted Zn-dependent protease with MMP-like domain